ncbi:MAG: hypothetical protein PHI11_12130 [Gallionella sp.]|nr:hypothetical protein [Gallionella sp.]
MNEISRIPAWENGSFDGMFAWFSEMSVRGLLFHPDDDPSDIVSVEDGASIFSDAESSALRQIITKMFVLNGDNVYEAGLPVFRASIGQFDA